MRLIQITTNIGTGVALSLLCGCASVKIQKVAADGKSVEGPDGLRYYMPRPYVSVYEPFVVGAEPFLVNGRVTADGNYVWIGEWPDALKSIAPVRSNTAGPGGIGIPVGEVRAATPERTGGLEGTGLSNVVKKATGGKKESSTGDTNAPAGKADSEKPPAEKPGTLSMKMVNDNQSFAVTPTRRFFDILWLPDFDEMYVVKSRAGFGNASVSMQMGQGWSLQGIEAFVDNSEIAKRAYALYDKSIELLLKYGQTALGIPPVGGLQGTPLLDDVKAGKVLAGQEITLKLTKTRLVSPGLYPILKPKELASFDPDGFQNVTNRILLPAPPLNNIAFSTYEVLVIEAVKPEGDSPLNFARYKDVAVPPFASSTGGGTTGIRATDAKVSVSDATIAAATKRIVEEFSFLESVSLARDGDGKFKLLGSLKAGVGKTVEEAKAEITSKLGAILNLFPGVAVSEVKIE